jgi:broad specificity phosphatase PhoE
MDGLPVHTFNDFIRADPVNIKTERGESFLEMMERLRNFLNEVAFQHPDGIVLAASHEHPILAVKALSGLNPEQAARDSIANCEWVEIDWT